MNSGSTLFRQYLSRSIAETPQNLSVEMKQGIRFL